MFKQLFFLMLLGLITSCSMGGRGTSEAVYEVVPLPKEITHETGEAFSLTSATKITYPEGNDKMKRNAEFLAEYLNIATGLKTSVSTESLSENAIILAIGLDSNNSEAYNINVNSKTITITGATEAGVFYGIQTLRKSTPIEKVGSVLYSSVNINDEPRFGYRGMSLDIARHFQSVEFIKKYIDMLALHNVNQFHWHLTEDQGWRIEIDSYPRLTEVGSMRSETVIGRN